uniref:E3 ubiquitin-protein ligase listerin n=1 Tax=Parastrongyloides trichosuri TaxID=131310 RepID=A0A0N4ZER7_PARTI
MKKSGGSKFKTASSLRSAENLISKGFSGGFIGFNAVAENTNEKKMEENELIIENLNDSYSHELKMILKKIEKKDKLTKEKGLKELKEIITNSEDKDEIKNIYDAYSLMFSKLCVHASPAIRSLSIELLKILILKLKKDASKQLKIVMPYVLFCKSDMSSQVKRQSDNLIDECFPGKKNQIYETFREQIDNLCMYIIGKSHKLMKPQKFVEDETDKQRESRLIGQSLGTLSKLMESLNDKSYNKELSEKFANPVIINHLTSLPSNVKGLYLELILKLSEDNIELFIPTKLSSIILSNLDNDDITLCKSAFSCFLKFSQNEKYFDKIDIDKAVIPKIIKIVRRCYVKWSFISDNLLPIFDLIYKRISKEKKQYFMESVLDGLYERECSKKTSDSFIQSICEIFKYSFFTSNGCNEFLDYLLKFYYKLVDYCFENNDKNIVKNVLELSVWILKKGKEKNILDDSQINSLIETLVGKLINKLPEYEDFAIKFYEATTNETFKRGLLDCLQISTELYLSLTEKKSINNENISLDPLFERFKDTDDQTIKVQILQKSLKESNEEELTNYFNKYLQLTDPFTSLALLQALDDSNINKMDKSIIKKCILNVYEAVKNKKISGLVYESMVHLYKYFDKDIYDNIFSLLSSTSSPEVFLALLDLIANGEYIPDLEENVVCFLFKILTRIKKNISIDCCEKFEKIFDKCKNDNFSVKDMNKIFEEFLKNKKMSRVYEFCDNAVVLSGCKFMPFLMCDSVFERYSKFLSNNFYSLLYESTNNCDFEGENNENVDVEGTFMLLLKRCVVIKNIIENGKNYCEEYAKKSAVFVKSMKRIVDLINLNSYMKNPELDYLSNVDKYNNDDLKVVLDKKYQSYPSFIYLFDEFKREQENVPTSLELKDLIESGKFRDKIYLDDDWEEWLFLYSDDKKKIKSMNYILDILLQDADTFNINAPENADDFRVCGLITLFCYASENIETVFSESNSIALQLFRSSIKYGCDIVTKREISAKDIRKYNTVAENYELKEWSFVVQSIFPNILKLFLHLSNMTPSFYITNINLINSLCKCILAMIDQIKSDDIVREANVSIQESIKAHVYVFTELMQTKISSHVQIVAASLFHAVLPLYFYYENKKLIDDTKKECENISTDKCVVILPPIITALLKKVDLEQLKIDNDSNGMPETYLPFELLLWNSLIYFFKTLETEEKLLYLDALDTELVSLGLGITMFYLPDVPFSRENNTKKHFIELAKFRNKTDDPYLTLSDCACYVFYQTLKTIPVLIRQWINLLPNSTKGSLKDYIVRYFSPLIIEEELNNSTNFKNDSDSRLSIKVYKVIKTIEATYEIEAGTGMSLRIVLQDDYPLSLPIVETDKSVVDKRINNKWLMQVSTYISHQNGLVVSGLQQWKRNFDKHLEGVENCSICIMIVNSVNNQLPRVKCKQCKHKFHAQCLYKWFNTSNQSTCPLCRRDFI